MPYLVVTEQCEIDTRNHCNGDIEPRASQAVELLHGGSCPLVADYATSGRTPENENENELKKTSVPGAMWRREQTRGDGYLDHVNLPAGVAARG